MITLIVTELYTTDKQLKKGKITNNVFIMVNVYEDHFS